MPLWACVVFVFPFFKCHVKFDKMSTFNEDKMSSFNEVKMTNNVCTFIWSQCMTV